METPRPMRFLLFEDSFIRRLQDFSLDENGAILLQTHLTINEDPWTIYFCHLLTSPFVPSAGVVLNCDAILTFRNSLYRHHNRAPGTATRRDANAGPVTEASAFSIIKFTFGHVIRGFANRLV